MAGPNYYTDFSYILSRFTILTSRPNIHHHLISEGEGKVKLVDFLIEAVKELI